MREKGSDLDIAHIVEVLEALVEDRARLVALPKEQRVALLVAAGRLSRPQRHETVRLAKAFRKVQRKKDKVADREARAATEIRAARLAEVYVPPPALPAGAASSNTKEQGAELKTPRNCYVCKAEFRRVHFFYDSMCGECAELNYQKRFQTAPLHGRVCVVTGARVKIGYQAALMLLRAGARVVVTTRFPHDAASRYARENDFETFADRLQIHGLDLRHCPSVELFARHLESTLGRLDFLLNNAAQTVRRPTGFYAHLVDREMSASHALPENERRVLASHEALKKELGAGGPGDGARLSRGAPDATGLATWRDGAPGIGIRSAALLSQLACTYDDALRGNEIFPEGRLDQDLQQIDLRTMNSWRMQLSDVPTPELLEVHLVNAVAPFILCSRLKPLMMKDPSFDRHIVNVTAMEGIFSRHTKTDKHPHTNMAKAALNMMTLTSAPDYAKCGIFMNAVDTGWVTDEDPAQISEMKRTVHDFQPPLDIVDGAARVCDPFFTGLRTGEHVYGKFLKDYRVASW